MNDFGLTREEIWRGVAREIGATWSGGDFWTPESILVCVAPWQITVTIERTGPFTLTKLSARFALPDNPLAFTIERRGLFGHAKLDLLQQFTPHAKFDGEFRVTTNAPKMLQTLLACADYRKALLDAPQFVLEARNGTLTGLGLGESDRSPQLIARIERVAETLQRLRDISSLVRAVGDEVLPVGRGAGDR
jgi:hypothetical protein